MTAELISHLNAALTQQLTCINQCFLHARILKHQGQLALADGEYKESIDSMKFSDMLVERILALGGIPNMQAVGPLMIGHTVPEMLKHDLAMKEAVRAQLLAAIPACGEDVASARLLERILGSIEEHIGYIHEQQRGLEAA